MAYWRKRVKGKITPQTFTLGEGINTYNSIYTIKRSEASDSRNASTREYPALSVRPGSTEEFGTDITPIATPNGAHVRSDGVLHVVDGTTWKKWNGASWDNLATGLTDAKAYFVEFNRETDTLTILLNGTDKKYYDGTSVSDLTEAQASKLATVDDSRLFVLDGRRVYYSKTNVPTDFTTADLTGDLTASGMLGPGTAIKAYNDNIIFFSDATMHLLYGNDTASFQLMDPLQTGCISQNSLIEHDAKLYFMDYDKFKVFTGGFPVEMSQKVRDFLENINYTYKEQICSGADGKYIYVSIPHGGAATDNNLTLEYDTEFGVWNAIDKGYVNFFNIGEAFYGVLTTGVIEKINTGTDDGGTAITWYHTTGIVSPTPVRGDKALSNIWLEVLLPTASTLTVAFASDVDGASFTSLYSGAANEDEQRVRIKIPTAQLNKQQRYRLKFSGTGPCTIHFVELEERVIVR